MNRRGKLEKTFSQLNVEYRRASGPRMHPLVLVRIHRVDVWYRQQTRNGRLLRRGARQELHRSGGENDLDRQRRVCGERAEYIGQLDGSNGAAGR